MSYLCISIFVEKRRGPKRVLHIKKQSKLHGNRFISETTNDNEIILVK